MDKTIKLFFKCGARLVLHEYRTLEAAVTDQRDAREHGQKAFIMIEGGKKNK